MFGARVSRCQHSLGGNANGGVVGDKGCSPEIQELSDSFGRHKDVAGLQVSMEHAMAMSVPDGFAHLPEEPHAIGDRQPALVAILVDPLAFDELDYQVGAARIGEATVRSVAILGCRRFASSLPSF